MHNQFPVNPEDFWENARKYSFYSDGMSQIYGPVAIMPPLEKYFKRKKITVSSQVIDAIVGGACTEIVLRKLSGQEVLILILLLDL